MLSGRLLAHYHPEYVERLCAWLIWKGGSIGVGGTFRPDGTQPDKPGFSPEGKSFHQNQRYSDGFIGATAVDLVAPDGPDGNNSHDGVSWGNVLPQGSAEAARWGLHCNVGSPPSGEPWHCQPVEIDGHTSWLRNGSPAPALDYPFPGRGVAPPPVPVPPSPSEYRRIAMTDSFEFGVAPRYDTRGFGAPIPAGQYEVNLKGSNRKVGAKVNLTIVSAVGQGYATAWPGDSPAPDRSSINFQRGVTIANQIDVPLADGRFKVYISADAHIIVDLVGYWS